MRREFGCPVARQGAAAAAHVTAMAGFKRRKYLVNEAQYRLLVFNFLYYLLFVGAVSAILWVPLVSGLHSPLTSPAAREDMARLFLYLHARILPVAVVLAVVSAVHSVLVSNRIVGPLTRFRHVFLRIGEGRLGDRIRLRKHDYLHEEAAALNTMSAELAARVQRVDEHFEELRTEWRAFRREMEGDEEAAFADCLPRLEQHFAECARALTAFELETRRDQAATLEAQPAIRSTRTADPSAGGEREPKEPTAGERPS